MLPGPSRMQNPPTLALKQFRNFRQLHQLHHGPPSRKGQNSANSECCECQKCPFSKEKQRVLEFGPISRDGPPRSRTPAPKVCRGPPCLRLCSAIAGLMSALPPRATDERTSRTGSEVPGGDSCTAANLPS